MVFIKTKHYPFKGFNAITHWPFVFYKTDNETMRRHEAIHGAQQKELLLISINILMIISYVFNIEQIFANLLIGYLILIQLTRLHKSFSIVFILLQFILNLCFYLSYGIEYLFKGYRGISFEKEAYENERYILYNRKHFQQWR